MDTSALFGIMDRLNASSKDNWLDRYTKRKEAVDDEARRRAEYMSDVSGQRDFLTKQELLKETGADKRDAAHYKFLREQAQEAVAERDAEREAEHNRQENERKTAKRERLYDATGYDGDPEKGTMEDEKKAIALGSQKLRKLIDLQSSAYKEAEALLTPKNPDYKKQVIANVLSDPNSIGIGNSKLRSGLADGTITLEEAQKALSSRDWSKFTALYSTHLADTLAAQKDETSKKVATMLREHSLKTDAINNAIGIAQRTLPTGSVLDAYSQEASGAGTTPAAAPRVGPADPNAGYAPTAPGKVAPVTPGVTIGPTASEPNTQEGAGLMKAPWQDYGLIPRIGGQGLSGLYNGVWADGLKPAGQATYDKAIAPAGRYLFTGNPAPQGATLGPSSSVPQAGPGGPTNQPMQAAAARQHLQGVFGTLDTNYLNKVRQWYIANSGMSPQDAEADVNATAAAAGAGNPEAIRKIQSIMSRARMYVPQDLPGGAGMPMDRPQTPFQPQATPVYQGPLGPGY